jgi:hypothetical protein
MLVVALIAACVGPPPDVAPTDHPRPSRASSDLGTGSTPPASTETRDPERRPGYLVSYDELQERAGWARRGVEPYAAAVDELLDWADDALDRRPRPERLLRIGGTGGPFVEDSRRAYGLALAFGVSGTTEYAEHARAMVLAWVERTDELDRACPDSGSCQTSLIVARMVPGFVFAADILEAGGRWSGEDRQALSTWLRTLILPEMPRLDNNWGDAGSFAEIVITDYIGDASGFAAAIKRWERRLDLIAADGHLPEETRREEQGIGYTQEALVYKIAAAVVAERRGIDLWTLAGKEGVTVLDALDYLARYWLDPSGWPWDDDPDVPSPGPLWELAYARWCNVIYLDIAQHRRPYGDRGNSAIRWTTLTTGVSEGDCLTDG